MLRVYIQLAMSVYRKRTFRQNDCFVIDGADFNFDVVTVVTLWQNFRRQGERQTFDKNAYTLHERQTKEECATRIKIAISSTVSPLRVASVSTNFHLQKKLIKWVKLHTYTTAFCKLDLKLSPCVSF